jgi:hypothetical protein
MTPSPNPRNNTRPELYLVDNNSVTYLRILYPNGRSEYIWGDRYESKRYYSCFCLQCKYGSTIPVSSAYTLRELKPKSLEFKYKTLPQVREASQQHDKRYNNKTTFLGYL